MKRRSALDRGASGPGPRRILVTAGPTRERIDPVRFLSNDSSGRMGFAIAAAAAAAGHQVTLIAGPVALATPRGVRRLDIESARELLAVARREFRRCDALVMAAAVADWRPARRRAGKWRGKDGGAARTQLELVRNPDVLATLSRGKGPRTVVGFALETGAGVRRARAKLAKKGLDFIVLNGPSALNAARTSVIILGSDGSSRAIARASKERVARELVRLCVPRPAHGH